MPALPAVVKQIQLLYPTEVAWWCVTPPFTVVRIGHPPARSSAPAGQFEPVLDALFEGKRKGTPEAPNIPRIGQIATEVGVNIEKARRDVALPEVTEVLRQDAEDLVALKVTVRRHSS